MNQNHEVLPIEAFKSAIMECDAPYIIVEAETGSGKSTRVPQWYYELGFRVLVTEPLIETVIGTSEYVAELMNVEFGSTVGYRTGESRCDSPRTDILFCTDGLALVRELSHHNRFDILGIDELHEWNTNQSTLEAWAWKHLQAGDSSFKKIVVLSATLDSDALSRKRGNAPIFRVPGRQFSIIDQPAGRDIPGDVAKLVSEGFDVLVFQPGKAEIAKTISDLVQAGVSAELIPFHGELERSEKNKAYKFYARPKVVVSTNALETGRTLLPSPDRKLAVVDSGMERRIELKDGIEVLALESIAKARGKQRRGRTGRVGDGTYIDHCPTQDRPEYPVPEILRTRLDQTVLRLAVAGYDATELPFFHELDVAVLADAKRALKSLGAMTEDGSVTKTGRLMARLPVNVKYARMIIEAERLGVVDDVITIAAILENESLRDRSNNWRFLTQEKESDLLAELDIWAHAEGMQGGEMRENGIFAPAYFRAKDLRRKLRENLRGVQFDSTGHRQSILKACVAGMVDHLYQSRSGEYQNGGTTRRQKARESVVTGTHEWIVGLPKDIQFKGRRGMTQTLHLVSVVSKVDPMWLAEIAPQLVRSETGLNPRYDVAKDSVVSTTKIFFNNQLVREEAVPDPKHPKAAEVFAVVLHGLYSLGEITGYNRKIREEAMNLWVRSGAQTRNITLMDESAHYWLFFEEHKVASLVGLRDAIHAGKFQANDLTLKLEDFVPREKQEKVRVENPDTLDLLEKQYTVTYRQGYAPSVELGNVEVDETWKRLPDVGVKLSSGREVVVVIPLDYHKLSGSDIPQLKNQVREYLNEKKWNVFTKPEIALPSATDEVVPEVVDVEYGLDSLTGEPVHMFGAVTLDTSYYRSSDFKGKWFKAREEAEAARAKVQEKLDAGSIAARREKAEREVVMAEARVAEERVLVEVRKQKEIEEHRVAEKSKRLAKEEKFAKTGVLADETSTGFNSFAAALAVAKQKKQKR